MKVFTVVVGTPHGYIMDAGWLSMTFEVRINTKVERTGFLHFTNS